MATDRERLRQELAQAKKHVIEGRRIVEAQRERTAKMRANGHSITTHEQLLRQFEQTLQAFEDHERLLMSEMAEARAGRDSQNG